MARLKLLSGLPLSPVTEPSQARFLVRVGGENVEIRATFLPADGDDTVILKRAIAPPDVAPIQALGLEGADLEELLRLFAQRRGLILVSGVGPGRTETLQSFARHLSLEGLQVMLLDRTLERRLSGVNHVVRPDGVECTFAEMLEWCCLQAPDAIVVGELPTKEAVDVAVRAAATGQLIIAGAWPSDVAETLRSLLDSEPDRPALGAALTAVLAQQRVRRICESCAKPYQLPFQLGQALRQALGGHEQNGYRRGTGCPQCSYKGWRGALGVYDLLKVDTKLRKLLAGEADGDQIAAHIAKHHPGLEREVLTLAEKGVIRPEELIPLGMAVAATFSTLNAKSGGSPIVVDVPVSPASEEAALELEGWDELAGALADLS
jgi:MSHA biogenesis protein MshE